MMDRMTYLARGTVVATLVVPLLTTGLTGCGLLDGGSRLEEALEYLPADTDSVTFVDRAKAAERLGVDDVDAESSDDDLEEYVDVVSGAGVDTSLTRWTDLMAESAAFTDLDVEWQAWAASDDEGAQVLKMSDDLDLDDVGDDLVDAGYDESGSDDVRAFTASTDDVDPEAYLIGERYPGNLLEVAVVPDEHLMIIGGWDEVIDAVLDDDDSMADDGGFDDLLDEADDLEALEFATLFTGDATCAGADPERRYSDSANALGRPESSAFFDAGPDHAQRAVLLFGSEDEAAADAEQREEVIPTYDEWFSSEGTYEVAQDGEVVTVKTDDEENIEGLHTRALVADGPLACGLEE